MSAPMSGAMRAETPDDTEVRQFWHCNAVPTSSRTSITAGTALFEGISIWPTIALRVFGGVLSLFLIWWTLRSLEINKFETAIKMILQIGNPTLAKAIDDVWNNPAFPRFWDKICSLLWFPPQTNDPNPLGYDDSGRPKVKCEDIVREFPLKWEIRCLRALAATLVMMALWLLILVPVFGDPTAPARGQRARVVYFLATLFDVMPTLFLTFLVVDATLLSRKFISRLTQISTVGPYSTAAKFNQRFGLWGEAIADWIDMQYLARRTQCITGLSTSRFCRWR